MRIPHRADTRATREAPALASRRADQVCQPASCSSLRETRRLSATKRSRATPLVMRHNEVRTLARGNDQVRQSMFVVIVAYHCTCTAPPKVITVGKRPNDPCCEAPQLGRAHRLNGSANAMRI
jgi:hypothetical protein